MKRWKDPLWLGFILSLVLHGSVCLVMFWGFLTETPSIVGPHIIPVDVVTLGPQSQAPRPKPTIAQKAPKAPEQSPLIEEKPLPEPEPELLKAEPVKETPAPIEKPKVDTLDPDAVPLPTKKPEKKPKKKKDKEPVKKPTPQSTKSKPPKKSTQKKKEKGIDSLLSTVDREDEAATNLDTLLDGDPDSTSTAQASNVGPLAISALDLINREVNDHWTKPPAAKGLDIRVVAEVEVSLDGKITKATILHDRGSVTHPLYQITAESILRTLRDPAIQVRITKEIYDYWKDNTVVLKFNTKE